MGGVAEVTGLLLAGGRSRRMGVDKALLPFDGRPLAVRVLGLLRQACPVVLVVSGDGERLAWLGCGQVADAVPGAGPLGGLAAGLERVRTPLAAVVAVDMPFASPAVLRMLAERWDGEDAVVPVTGEGPQPLHAVYAASAAPALRAALAGPDRSVRGALRSLRVSWVGPEVWRAADPSGRFAVNLNRPEDLARAAREP